MPIPPNIPWDQVLRHGPRVLDAATALFDKWQSRRPEPVNPHDEAPHDPLQVVERRLQTLETAEAEQAALVREMARELQGLSEEVQRQRVQTRIALSVAGLAVLLAVAAIVTARLG